MTNQRNAFDAEIPSIAEIVSSSRMSAIISKTLKQIMAHLGVEASKAFALVEDILDAGRTFEVEFEYEEIINARLDRAGVLGALPEILRGRSQLVFDQILPFLRSGQILDLGCGDGKVGALITYKEYGVTLCDVYEHPNIQSLGLPFVKYSQSSPLPIEDNTFDTVLLLTVIHHSGNPLGLIREAQRVLKPGGQAVIIESVFGVSALPHTMAATNENTHFVSLAPEEQRYSNIFFDHFYNRIIHFSKNPATKVNVPFNFNTPENWKSLFELNALRETSLVHLGIDQPVVPEYHTLHSCEKLFS